MKLLVREQGSEVAEELWNAADLRVASELLYPEARAALASAERAARLSADELRGAVRDLEQAMSAMTLLGVDRALSRRAGELAEAHALRGYDAVHLATALMIEPSRFVLITWDRDLARAALESGRSVAPAID